MGVVVLHQVLTSSLLGVLLLGLLGSCGSRTVRGRPSAAAFCDELQNRFETCELEVALDSARCESAFAALGEAESGRARACLNSACSAVVACVEDELGPLPSGSGGSGGTDGMGTAGSPAQACPAPVSCHDAATAQYCDDQGVLRPVDCALVLEAQGIISNGCSVDAAGAGCTVDGFLDAGCEAGTPPFAVCAGLTEKDLVNTYVACFQNVSEASTVIPCYGDYVDEAQQVVDCGAAQTACSQP